MNNYIEKGDKIQCPECGAIIGTFNVEPRKYEILRLKMIAFEEGQEKIKGEATRCNNCDASYAKLFMFIKDKGWVGAS